MKSLILMFTVTLLAACTQPADPVEDAAGSNTGGEHVWKTQTDQIDRAREVEDTLMDEAARQRQAIDAQSR